MTRPHMPNPEAKKIEAVEHPPEKKVEAKELAPDTLKASIGSAETKVADLKKSAADLEAMIAKADPQMAEMLRSDLDGIKGQVAAEELKLAEVKKEASATTAADKETEKRSLKDLEKEASALVNTTIKRCKAIEEMDFEKIENPGPQIEELKQTRESALAQLNELIAAELADDGPKKANMVLGQMRKAGIIGKLDRAMNRLAQKANGAKREDPLSHELQTEYSAGETAEALKMSEWNMKLRQAESPAAFDAEDMLNGELADFTNEVAGTAIGTGLSGKLGPEGVRLISQKKDEFVKRLIAAGGHKSEKHLLSFGGDAAKYVERINRALESSISASDRRRKSSPETKASS